MDKKNNKFPFAIPFGGGGNKELITVVKDREKAHLNTIGKSRFSIEDGTDIAILLDIADGDEGTKEFIESLCAVSFAEDGLSRGEQIMMVTGVVDTGSMPGRINSSNRPDRSAVHQKGKHPEEDNNE